MPYTGPNHASTLHKAKGRAPSVQAASINTVHIPIFMMMMMMMMIVTNDDNNSDNYNDNYNNYSTNAVLDTSFLDSGRGVEHRVGLS